MTFQSDIPAPMIVVLGDISVDHVLGPVDEWPRIGTEILVRQGEMRPGGSGGNTALALRALGRRCGLISAIGSDFFGSWLGDQFSGADVEVRLERVDAPTSVSVCMLHSDGERSIFTVEGHLEIAGAESFVDRLAGVVSPGALLLLTGSFIMPGVSRDYATIIREARRCGYEIAIDTGWPPQGWGAARADTQGWLALADHALLNAIEVKGIAGVDDLETAIARVSAMMAQGSNLVVKCGPEGAIGAQDGVRCHAPAHPVAVFDTVGAGDAFNAGYLDARVRGGSLQQALAAGCRSASQIIDRFPRATIRPGEFACSDVFSG